MRTILSLGISTMFVLLSLLSNSYAQSNKKVFVFSIKEEIGPISNRLVNLALEEATAQQSDAVIIELDTYGGALDAADDIRKKILDFPKPVYVFINKNAASAGALISLACDSIYMSPGSTIGAATVVNQEGVPMPDKYQSYMRSLMRATAEVNHRDTYKAEQMVGILSGPDSTVITQVLSYSADQAIENKFCEAKLTSVEQVLKQTNLNTASVYNYQISITEQIIAFFLNPYLRGILILIMVAGIYYEMQAPGIGFALLASVVAALLYFVPSYLNGLAENWEIMIFFLGIILMGIELFVIPGFGVIGVTGIVFLFASFILVIVNNDFLDFTFVDGNELTQAVGMAMIACVASMIMVVFLGPKLLESKAFKRIALQETMASNQGYNSNFISIDLSGKVGIAHTVLRPSGKVEIEGIVYDAYTAGDFVEKGSNIVVVEHKNTSVKVKQV